MFIPKPSFVPLVKVINQNILDVVATLPDTLSVGVGVFGTAAAYALVWELGSKRLKAPGPKTVWGINRLGKKAILTKQAPKGYVGIHVSDAQKILKNALNSVELDLANLDEAKLQLEVALDNAALEIAKLMSESAPVDSGDLRSQIHSIDSDEAEFLNMDSEGTLFL